LSLALVALGSNLGDRDAHLRAALEHLERAGAGRVVALSRFHTTAPAGGPPQGDFRNAAALLETSLGPRGLLQAMQRAEAASGRRRGGPGEDTPPRWGPREVDLDLLLYDELVLDEPGLVVPHPRMTGRRFVLEPAAEVAPTMVHPPSGRTVAELLEDLPR
jgi:2-amino-4-hydroxy-6-hydroxymethyldihydropteridine diphosphokinase